MEGQTKRMDGHGENYITPPLTGDKNKTGLLFNKIRASNHIRNILIRMMDAELIDDFYNTKYAHEKTRSIS